MTLPSFATIVSVMIFSCSLLGAAAPTQDQLSKIESAKQLLSSTEDVQKQIDLMCELADLYYTIDPDSGLAYGQSALTLAYTNEYAAGKINAHDRLGFLYQSLGKFEKASEHLITALQLSEVSPDSAKTIDILNHLGAMNYNQNTEQALNFYLKALQLSQKLNDNRRIASSFNHIGMIYLQQKNYEKALENNLKSLTAWNAIDSMQTAGVSSDIGNIYYRLLDYKSALSYYQRAYRIAERRTDYLALGYTLANIGIVLMEMGDMPEALEKLQASLKYRELLNNAEGISNSLVLIARWHYKQRKYDDAYSFAMKNFSIAYATGLKSSITDAYEILVDILTAQRQYAKALQFQADWMAYKDSVMDRESSSQLAKMEVLFEIEKKDTENKLLKEKQAKTEAVLERQVILTLSAAVLLLLSSIGIFLLYKSNKAKNEINLMLQSQNAVVEQQKTQLANLHTIKDKLFSIVTHDLRGPISSLKMFITYLRDEELDPKMIKEYTQQSAATIDQIMLLMENILHWSKSQWKGMIVESTNINLYQIAKEKIRIMEPEAGKKGITLQNTIPPASEAYGDLQMIDIVFRNLISNAIKFTEEKGTVRIRCAEYDDIVEVSIEDSGIGMTVEQIQKSFSFDFAPVKGTNDERGAGLGLVLCKEFVELNGGMIRVESVLGTGSVFTFTLPRSKRSAAESAERTVSL